MSNPEQPDPTARPNHNRILRGAAAAGATILGVFDVFALDVGALDDVPTFVKDGGAPAVEKSLSSHRTVQLAGHIAFNVTCQLSAIEVVGTVAEGMTYGVDPRLLVPENPADRTADWTHKLHDCSQPIQYNSATPTP